MPFTISHAAAVLPLPRKRLPLSALVVGSMAPDFPYFVLLSDVSRIGHTIPGLFIFCIPVGMATLWLFHRYLKLPLLALAPNSLRSRIPAQATFRFFPVWRFLLIAICVLLGAVTHILWDGLTHLNGIFVAHWPALRLVSPFWPYQPLFSLLQHFSSVIGLLLLVSAYLRWTRKTPPTSETTVPPLSTATKIRTFAWGILLVAAIGIISGCHFALRQPHIWKEVFIIRTVIGGMAGGIVSVAVYATWWHIRMRKAPEAMAPEASVSSVR
ncbi:MAG TPA: DUF4184 family protein [Terriglobales bacterium]|nr:DUF4184 family protein [Terriglobales bacterium]